MAKSKAKSAFVCSDCGSEYSKWQGQCVDCQAWNTLTEIKLGAAPVAQPRLQGYAGAPAQVQRLGDIDLASVPRMQTGMSEFDQVPG